MISFILISFSKKLGSAGLFNKKGWPNQTIQQLRLHFMGNTTLEL